MLKVRIIAATGFFVLFGLFAFYFYPGPPIHRLGDQVSYLGKPAVVVRLSHINNLAPVFYPPRYQWRVEYAIEEGGYIWIVGPDDLD